MKKLSFTFTIILLCLAGKAQTPYHYYNYEGKKKYLSLNTGYAFLSLKEQQIPINILQRHNVVAVELSSDRTDNKQYKGEKREKPFLYRIAFRGKNVGETIFRTVIVSPYFKSKSNDKVGLSNFF